MIIIRSPGYIRLNASDSKARAVSSMPLRLLVPVSLIAVLVKVVRSKKKPFISSFNFSSKYVKPILSLSSKNALSRPISQPRDFSGFRSGLPIKAENNEEAKKPEAGR